MKRYLMLIFLLAFHFCNAQEESSGGFDALRIENEIKLTVPVELCDSVWEYLQSRFANDQRDLLKEIDRSFHFKMAIDSFTDQYFDDERFNLLDGKIGVRYRSRTLLTDPGGEKDGRELMQIKINDVGNGRLSRGEYKYEIEHYRKAEAPLDYHPFLGRVKRKHRNDIVERLEEYNINALNLSPTVRITQIRKRIYIYRGYAPFSTLTLDNVKAEYNRKSATFSELELELNELRYTDSDSSARREMEKVNEIVKSDILSRFPSIHQDQTPKYNKAAQKLGIDTEKGSLTYWLVGIMFLLAILFATKSNPFSSWMQGEKERGLR